MPLFLFRQPLRTLRILHWLIIIWVSHTGKTTIQVRQHGAPRGAQNFTWVAPHPPHSGAVERCSKASFRCADIRTGMGAENADGCRRSAVARFDLPRRGSVSTCRRTVRGRQPAQSASSRRSLESGATIPAEKKWPQAEQEFETAIRLDAANPRMVSVYAEFLVSRQENAKAIVSAQRFVEASPNSASGHMILGVVQYKAKNNAAARKEFERAIEIDPKMSKPISS